MPDVTTVPRVEVLRTGSWDGVHGQFKITGEHLRSAVEAFAAAVLPAPVLKLGHAYSAELGDAAPALGRLARLRIGDDGQALVADLDGVPTKLARLLRFAWPNRSIEGRFGYVDHTGRTWPFVVEALALLGGTLPAVKTLRDVDELYDVAAAHGGRPVTIAASTFHTTDDTAARQRAVAVAAARRRRNHRTLTV
jgi:hypothetical protein